MRPSTAADTFGAEAEALFQELASGSTEGILVLDKRGRIAWVNEAALRMHDAHRMDELGDTAVGYRKRYQLHYRTRRKLPAGQYPIDRLMRAGGFHDLCVHVTRKDDDEFHRVFQFRGLALDQVADSCGALVLQDATQRFEAQERFERTFDVNPAPAIICRVSDLRYIKV